MTDYTPTIEEQIKSTIATGMKEIHDEQMEIIKKVIKETVNGKIDAIKNNFDEYVTSDIEWKKEDKAWKAAADPYIKGLANISGTGKILVWIAVGISSIAGAYLAIKQLFK